MKPDYINPHEGQWVANDFRGMIGETIIVDDHKFVIQSVGVEHTDLVLRGTWPDRSTKYRRLDPRVWPNMQWVALNWSDE